MISIRQLPPELPYPEVRELWEHYSVTGDLVIRDKIFEGMMRKIYVWCWPYTRNYPYGDEALSAAYEKLYEVMTRSIDLPFLRAHCTGACMNYARDHRPSIRRYAACSEISTDDVTKLDVHGTTPVFEYGVTELIVELRLSPMERKILDLTIGGYSAAQVGLAVGRSRRHVDRILNEIRLLIARKYNWRGYAKRLP